MVHEWVRPFCTKVRGSNGILDGFDSEFYIRFDCEEDPENPKSKGTCDIHVVSVGNACRDGVRVIADANRAVVLCFLFSLGIKRFTKSIQEAIVEASNENRKVHGDNKNDADGTVQNP